MKLYHGSTESGLKHLSIGDSNKQGSGIYLTDSIDQANFYGKYGSVYTVELKDGLVLDYSDENLMNDVFLVHLNKPLVKQEV